MARHRTARRRAPSATAAPCWLVTAAAVALLASGNAEARMYQWTHPATGTVQLSGQPPAWYRGTRAGPRVLVFDNGELVDDTAIEVSEAQRRELREQAFSGGGAEIVDPAEASREELKAAMERAQDLGVDVDTVTEEFHQEQEAQAAAAEDATGLAERVAQLKSLIDAFDQRQLERAKAILGEPAATGGE